jgi:hypothetical protein
VATMHEPGSALARDLLEELRRRFPGRVAPAVIRLDPLLKESASFGQPIVEYAPESAGAADYASLAAWLETVPATPGEPAAEVPAEPVILTGHVARAPSLPGEAGFAPEPAPGDETPALWAECERPPEPAAVPQASLQARRAGPRGPAAPAAGEPASAVEPKPAPAEPARSSFGVEQTGHEVVFIQPLFLGRGICVAGKFNGWSATASPMTRDEAAGVHVLRVTLPPGRWQYRLVVDGRWMADPFNASAEMNEFGEPNSAVDVAEAVELVGAHACLPAGAAGTR